MSAIKCQICRHCPECLCETGEEKEDEFERPEPLPIEITHQGKPLIDDACILHKSESIMVIGVNTTSKYVETFSDHGNTVVFVADPKTQKVKEDAKDDWTEVKFPTLDGWHFAVKDPDGRYQIRLCMVKGPKQ